MFEVQIYVFLWLLRSDDWAFLTEFSGISLDPVFKAHSLNFE